MEELRERAVIRSANNPTGDLAEFLFCKAFNWVQAPNSMKSYDATDTKGYRYQIKGRRVHRRNASRQLSAIRDFDGEGFDWLTVVLFDDDYNILRAALVPRNVVAVRGVHVKHTNSLKFMMTDSVWANPGVQDVTINLKKALA
ncbi:hypothetical protein [Algimonas arctica]|nr:hypothetical protein [Algimonas arctica]